MLEVRFAMRTVRHFRTVAASCKVVAIYDQFIFIPAYISTIPKLKNPILVEMGVGMNWREAH